MWISVRLCPEYITNPRSSLLGSHHLPCNGHYENRKTVKYLHPQGIYWHPFDVRIEQITFGKYGAFAVGLLFTLNNCGLGINVLLGSCEH